MELLVQQDQMAEERTGSLITIEFTNGGGAATVVVRQWGPMVMAVLSIVS